MKNKPSEEFEKFDDAMGKLLAVPYSDLKQRMEEEKQNKAGKKKKRAATSPASSHASSVSKKQAS